MTDAKRAASGEGDPFQNFRPGRSDSTSEIATSIAPGFVGYDKEGHFVKPKRRRRTKATRDGRCGFIRSDGGRRASGYRATKADCVPRAIAVAAGKPYHEVLSTLTAATSRYVQRYPRSWIARWIRRSRNGRGYDPSNGCYDKIYHPYLESIGWQFTSTKDEKVHLRADELPPGRLIVRVHRHLVAVIDGVIHDTYDSGRAGRRPVLGYYTEAAS